MVQTQPYGNHSPIIEHLVDLGLLAYKSGVIYQVTVAGTAALDQLNQPPTKNPHIGFDLSR